MREKLDNILLSILWLVVVTLGTCFWFNIRFGFNIFSGAHWRHLAYMQATQTPVQPTFYISLVLVVVIAICGLGALIKPKSNTKKPKPVSTPQPTHTPTQTIQPAPQTTTQSVQTPVVAPTQSTPITNTNPAPDTPDPILPRPARLNLPKNTTWKLPTAQTAAPTNTIQDWPELREIFESADYTTKETPRIGNVNTALLAIGADENLWVGAVGITTDAMQVVIEKLQDIFTDTLEDIEINTHGFIISAPDATAPSAPEILTFDTIGDLRQYMEEHKNPPLNEDERENFEAFSSYISTVIEYIGKI